MGGAIIAHGERDTMAESFNPNSTDAVLSSILTKLENQHDLLKSHIETTHVYREDLKATIDSMNGRVTALEGDKKRQQGVAIGAGLGAGLGGGGIAATLLKLFGGGSH